MKKPVRIANAQAFWGDNPLGPCTLLSQDPWIDYLTLDYLSEVSMSILSIQREKDSQAGYAKDFLDVVTTLLPIWQSGSQTKIITNAGGLNPLECGKKCQELLSKKMKKRFKIAVITGDDVLSLCQRELTHPLFCNLETGDSLKKLKNNLTTANAYLGAEPIKLAIENGADIVITGRVADPSLTVGPCAAYYGWNFDQYDQLAGATVAGHLIECGTQVTGGISTYWLELQDPANIGFPIAEVFENGSCIITKTKESSGIVSLETVKEQLLYEIGDPENYLSPDCTVSFSALAVQQIGKDRVEIKNAIGKAPPATYKVSATYREGYRSEAFLTIIGFEAGFKAKKAGEIIRERLSKFQPENFLIECLGADSTKECVLRIAVIDKRMEVLEFFSKQIASLVTCGPQGTTGYTSGRPLIRPVFGFWPCLIEREKVQPVIRYLEVPYA